MVVCANVLGSCYGSTGPQSIDPRTGAPYGNTFPQVIIYFLKENNSFYVGPDWGNVGSIFFGLGALES